MGSLFLCFKSMKGCFHFLCESPKLCGAQCNKRGNTEMHGEKETHREPSCLSAFVVQKSNTEMHGGRRCTEN